MSATSAAVLYTTSNKDTQRLFALDWNDLARFCVTVRSEKKLPYSKSRFGCMIVNVKLINNTTVPVEVGEDATVSDLNVATCRALGVDRATKLVRLVYGGQLLQGTKTMRSMRLENGASVHAVISDKPSPAAGNTAAPTGSSHNSNMDGGGGSAAARAAAARAAGQPMFTTPSGNAPSIGLSQEMPVATSSTFVWLAVGCFLVYIWYLVTTHSDWFDWIARFCLGLMTFAFTWAAIEAKPWAVVLGGLSGGTTTAGAGGRSEQTGSRQTAAQAARAYNGDSDPPPPQRSTPATPPQRAGASGDGGFMDGLTNFFSSEAESPFKAGGVAVLAVLAFMYFA